MNFREAHELLCEIEKSPKTLAQEELNLIGQMMSYIAMKRTPTPEQSRRLIIIHKKATE